MTTLLATAACNLDSDILNACYPLFAEERVQAIEWSFDVLFNRNVLPPWFEELLHAYSQAKRLTGHGVFFSLFSGKWLPEQAQWLETLRATTKRFPLEQVTEHFGFMTGKDFHAGAPLTIPYSATTLRIGRDRLRRIQDAAQCPVGLENLAFAYTSDDVKRHGYFLHDLIEPVNGFIILDLHNVYCQLENFGIDANELLALYPLHKVREIHISGGSWEPVACDRDRRIRRDTHDDAVPAEVFSLLEMAIDRCAECKYVVLEQVGSGLKTPASRQQFYNDFLQMEKVLQQKNKSRHGNSQNNFLPLHVLNTNPPPEDEFLFQQQRELSRILESDIPYNEAVTVLRRSSLANSVWNIENWNPAMLETAMQIARKWKGE
ncbi:DUF692 domain-containing protein [Niastella caeni]|uniref:DUF692 domain-containing protein n=1 Tax=Niastella caeni TaxID=2569763 RepID=A0A4S8HDA9_9BACT|nr:DUF692 family multinuclear iron-containing protein [Niastella caeni]THU32907.1 DUF692 domain-containing protein [Niastella caeni]